MVLYYTICLFDSRNVCVVAFVMTLLFRKGSLREQLRAIVKLTYEHTRNLALFVGIYKACLEVLRRFNSNKTRPGRPAAEWHAALAGAIGGYLVWSKYSSVNYQIVMYLFSRIVIALVKRMAANGVKPFCLVQFKQVYPSLAIATWAIVMWLFETNPETLHPSLKKSMDFLYHDSNEWPNGISDFFPSTATALTCLAKWSSF